MAETRGLERPVAFCVSYEGRNLSDVTDPNKRRAHCLAVLGIALRASVGSLVALGLFFVVATVTPMDSLRALAGPWQQPIPDAPTFRGYLTQRQALNLQQAINRR